MVAELTKNERQGALVILLALAVTGLAMAAGGRGDPFGVHGALVLVVSIAGIVAVIGA
jgi:cytochrome c oxidase cbb3-type subunit 1